MVSSKLPRGTQIIYVPDHIQDRHDYGYPNGAQPGFITSGPTADGSYFCRYWIIRGGRISRGLRTTANSELTPLRCIRVEDTVDQKLVDRALEAYG